MIIYPAIDIIGGKCVRLTQGEYDKLDVYNDDPIAVARKWIDELGDVADKWLHIVDLDGAKAGKPINADIIAAIAAIGCNVQTGGGNRTVEHIEQKLQAGVKRVILGTAAVKNKDLVAALVREYGSGIAVGIDAKDGKAAISGWTDESGIDAVELAKQMEAIGISTIIYTDISKDGMLSGINLAAMSEMANSISCDIIASGGVTSLDDITALAQTKVSGAIIGKALYTGHITIREALACTQKG